LTHSTVALAAFGFIAYYLTVMWHEIVGHGAMMVAFGARHLVLTSNSMDSNDPVISTLFSTDAAERLVAINGSVANVALGAALYPLLSWLERRDASIEWRFFAWLMIAVNLFFGASYVAFSGVSGVGDWADAIYRWPAQWTWRWIEVIAGVVLCVAVTRLMATRLRAFPGGLARLTLVPYISASILYSVASLSDPNPRTMIIATLPAAFIGQGVLLFAPLFAHRGRSGLPFEQPAQQVIQVYGAVLVLAMACIVLLVYTAPGIKITL
jgi:hypothetical protein